MNNQRKLERLMIEELRSMDALDDVVCGYALEYVRVCTHCKKLMNNGWIYNGAEPFCSNRCLLAEHPDEDINALNAQASDNNSDTFWTSWGL